MLFHCNGYRCEALWEDSRTRLIQGLTIYDFTNLVITVNTMPTTQTQIQFPVRKSARRKTAKSCDNVISEEEPSRITRSRKVLTDTDVNKENVSEHRKSSKSKKLSKQSEIIAKHETTPKLAAGSCAVTPSKRRAKPDIADSSSPTKIKAQASSENRLPFSPSKQQSSIISVTPSG